MYVPHHQHLRPRRARSAAASRVPAVDLAGRSLTVFGEAVFRGHATRFGLLPEDRLRHTWIIGKTGTGKSTLVRSLVAQDLQNHVGLAVLDPHGSLAAEVATLASTTPHRLVVRIAPGEEGASPSFNVFRRGPSPIAEHGLLASELVSVFKHRWADSWGPRMEHYLRFGILAVAHHPRASLGLLHRFYLDEDLRQRVVDRALDPYIRDVWEREFASLSPRLRSEALAPIMNKLGSLVAHPVAGPMLRGERSRLDFDLYLEKRVVLIVDLAVGRLGEDMAALIGSLILSSLYLASMRRGRSSPPFFCYLDEFQHFVSGSIPTVLSESRKYGLGLVLSHQYLGQLGEHVRDAVLGNVGTRLFFRIGAQDARVLGPTLEPTYTAGDLMLLPAYHAIATVTARGQELTPFLARMLSR